MQHGRRLSSRFLRPASPARTTRRAAALVAGLLLVAGGCNGDAAPGEDAAGAAAESAAATTAVTAVAPATTSPATAATPATTTPPATTASTAATTSAPTTAPAPTTTTEPALGPGANGPKVAALQARLAELGYHIGAADGAYGSGTTSAVMAFQKVEQLSVDGVPGPETLARLDNPRGSVPSGGGLHIEIDLSRQVLFVVGAGGGTRIFNTSTGNNEPFTWPDGTEGLAYTPTGTFAVYYRVDGVDDGALGAMYRPLYFHGDWAIHGSGYVPAYPASHGCARVSNAGQDWIWAHVPTGTPVVIY